ncbi:hypothetical protein [Flindersiella endophytica]
MTAIIIVMLTIVTIAAAVIAFVSFPENAPIHGPLVRDREWWED